ncbi:DUF4911 domain-containing protein [uncultured Mailhella sp.]|uniref:DUF4911 domain-containing protein n=1 Tax=uncultured Mailhella sp. TaxID=1981031 RepID=UPI002629526B|nr:DUF4911 domain-containing protein [uncultured Mailhella sp.]
MDEHPFPCAGRGEPEHPHRRFGLVRLPAAAASEILLIRIAPCDTGLFRYILEGGCGHLTMLTVLDPKAALFKILFSPHQRDEVFRLLDCIRRSVPLEILPFPY